MGMMDCSEGLTVDEPTFNAIQKGTCIPGCYFETSNFHCIFEARFGPSIITGAPPPVEAAEVPEGVSSLFNSSMPL